jgi:hypothetical protein
MSQIVNVSKTRGRLIDLIRKASAEKLEKLSSLLGVEVAYVDPKRVDVKVIQNGVIVDGLRLISAHCSCTGNRSHCCSTYSKVEVSEALHYIRFWGSATSGFTSGDYGWGYTVEKEGWAITVVMYETKSNTSFAGEYPPDVKDFVERGWAVTLQYNTASPEED